MTSLIPTRVEKEEVSQSLWEDKRASLLVTVHLINVMIVNLRLRQSFWMFELFPRNGRTIIYRVERELSVRSVILMTIVEQLPAKRWNDDHHSRWRCRLWGRRSQWSEMSRKFVQVGGRLFSNSSSHSISSNHPHSSHHSCHRRLVSIFIIAFVPTYQLFSLKIFTTSSRISLVGKVVLDF